VRWWRQQLQAQQQGYTMHAHPGVQRKRGGQAEQISVE